jgi:hypothetical protein
MSSGTAQRLLRRGLALECATLSWNVIGTVVVITAALAAGSVALAGFGLDSLIEIGASTIVIWQLKDTTGTRERRALHLVGSAFIALAIYIAGQAMVVGRSARRAGDRLLRTPRRPRSPPRKPLTSSQDQRRRHVVNT